MNEKKPIQKKIWKKPTVKSLSGEETEGGPKGMTFPESTTAAYSLS
jgi:hypothetical protein